MRRQGPLRRRSARVEVTGLPPAMARDAIPSAQAILGSTVSVPDYVVHRSFASEIVVLNLETGQYHGLNRTAGRMLEVLEETKSVSDAIGELIPEFDAPEAQIETDVIDFCSDLASRGLILLEPDTAQ